jgi:hypothetical protein
MNRRSLLSTRPSFPPNRHNRQVNGLSPGESPAVANSSNLVLRSQVHDALTAATSSGGASASMPLGLTPALFRTLAPSLCAGQLDVRAVGWAMNKHGCQAASPSPPSSPRINATSPVGSFTISSCGGRAVTVANLSTPVSLVIPTPPAALIPPQAAPYTRKCRRGLEENVTITCSNGLTLDLHCDGLRDYDVSGGCPVVGACVFWNASRRAWDTRGCEWVSSQGNGTRVRASHLTDFSVFFTATYAQSAAVFASYKDLDSVQFLRKNYGE